MLATVRVLHGCSGVRSGFLTAFTSWSVYYGRVGSEPG
jgi:hypothetical protein